MKKARKSLKKAMLLTVTALLLAISLPMFSQSKTIEAATCRHPYSQTRIVAPTCTSRGYTESFCVSCRQVLGKYNYTNILYHHYAPATCAYPRFCTNPGCNSTIGSAVGRSKCPGCPLCRNTFLN